MRTGGQTTVIRRVLERRAQQPPAIQDDTSSTIAVMLRCLPPPRALLAIGDTALCNHIRSHVAPDMLDFEVAADDAEALELFRAEFRPVVLTDSLETVRGLRSQQGDRTPFILYISELDEGSEREAGVIAGADDCIGRRAAHRGVGSGPAHRSHRESQALHH
jgi:CheY-like chemotaxis protein